MHRNDLENMDFFVWKFRGLWHHICQTDQSQGSKTGGHPQASFVEVVIGWLCRAGQSQADQTEWSNSWPITGWLCRPGQSQGGYAELVKQS